MGKKEFSTAGIDLGVQVQRLGDIPLAGSAYRAARWLWAGSGSASHVWVRWQQVDEVTRQRGESGLVQTRPNEEAGWSPRNYKRAAVFAAGVTAVSRVLQEHGPHGQPALAYEYDGITYAGPLERPQGFGVLQLSGTPSVSEQAPDEVLLAGAARQGSGALVGGIGLLYPEHGQLVIPGGMHLVKDLVPTRSMARLYPGVPMV